MKIEPSLRDEVLDALDVILPSPRCRDCADADGMCPNSRTGRRPCDTRDAKAWAEHKLHKFRSALQDDAI